ncbi:MAG: hypothetical protein WB679_19265 [Terracidiphilus sp.]
MLRLICAPILAFALAPMLCAQSCTQCNPGPTPGVPPDGYTWVFNTSTCSYQLVPLGPSPIVIDTDGTGFHLTSAVDGVKFDFYGTGTPIQIAWTAKGSTNGWLALPVNGQITSARDLFGNITPQPLANSHPPNGFAALSIYDTTAYGGNNNGAIDSGDAIWPSLRVWIDTNHDGIAQPEELHTLEDIGIERILLQYELSLYTDQNGNHFRYEGHLVPVSGDNVDRKIFDVFLATQ